MDLQDKNIVVVGLARTGVAVARFLAERGARVTVTDMKDAEVLATYLEKLSGLDITYDLGRHTPHVFLKADLIVVSPGVPMDIKPLAMARAQRRQVISEIELASRFIGAPIVAITGTNGKTTTTTLTGEIFGSCAFRTFVGGNIDPPLIELPLSGEEADRVVAEISSFQLEGVEAFRPKVAVLLNITEDHLDRYESYDEYIAAKLRIFENQTPEDYAVLNADDAIVAGVAGTIKSRPILFSRIKELPEGIFWKNDTIVFRLDGREERFPSGKFQLRGEHNKENILASLASTLLLGADPAKALTAVEQFRGLRHRMELVRELDGVPYYEDSKGTNVGSVVRSLESFPPGITLIAGGKDKGGSYEPLAPLVKERVRHLILIGEARARMLESLGSLTETVSAETLEEAVELAWRLTEPGGTVLFSPACSSFDMFKDYAERAERFVAAVKALRSKNG
jgi:UDP-N-acetylmuramoylalanine--D-glutamate ligase